MRELLNDIVIPSQDLLAGVILQLLRSLLLLEDELDIVNIQPN